MNNSIKILVVEDERIIAEDIQRNLNGLGYSVIGLASSYKEVFEIFENTIPDLILMDIIIPGDKDGIEIAKIIQSKHDIPIVYLTAYSEQGILERAKLTTPYGYLLKPFAADVLKTTIEIALYRHDMETKLKAREEWFSTTLKSINDGVLTADIKGHVSFMNSVAESLTGWTLNEASGKPVEEIIKLFEPDTNETIDISGIFNSNKENINITKELNLHRKNEHQIPIDYSCAPIQSDNGKIQGFVFILRDITERRRAAEALQNRLELEDIITQISTRFINLEPEEIEKGLKDSLRIVAEFTKMDRSYVLQFSSDKQAVLTHEWLRGGMYSLASLIKTLSSDEIEQNLFIHRNKSHVQFIDVKSSASQDHVLLTQLSNMGVQTSITILLKKGRKKVGVLGFDAKKLHQDWTAEIQSLLQIMGEIVVNALERQQMLDALYKAEQDKTLVLSNINEEVIFHDMEHQIIWLNDAAAKSAGKTSDELTGQSCEDLWRIKHADIDICPVHDCLKTGEHVETELKTNDNKYWTIQGNPVKNEQGEIIGLVEIIQEITTQKKAQEERESMERQLMQSQKMEALGTLTGGVAHDFNNLLTAIQGCIDMAIMRVDDKSPIYNDLTEVRNAASQASDLTRQLLLFSRKHPTKFMAINLNETINDLLKILHRLIGEDAGVNTALADKLWTVKADKGRIEQIVMNLAINARDAMPNGGEFTIKTENVSLDKTCCRGIPEAHPGKFVRLSISDTGAGMEKKVLDHIFEPFFSTKGIGKGTGLGLSVVYGIVKDHNGWISVSSEVDKGTLFEIMIEAVHEKPEQNVKEKISFDDLRGHGERILLVEDAQGVREFAKLALEENGYDVFDALTINEAIQRFQQGNKNFDLLFSDVVLPDLNGLELIEQLHRENENMKILLTSGYTDQKSQWPIIQECGYAFLQKPYTLVQLLHSIKDLFAENV